MAPRKPESGISVTIVYSCGHRSGGSLVQPSCIAKLESMDCPQCRAQQQPQPKAPPPAAQT